MRKNWLSAVPTVLMVCCALIMTGLVLRRELRENAGGKPEKVRDWQSLSSSGNRMGPPKADATIVVFSDFQCPACKQFALMKDTILKRYPNVAIVYRHFPLPNHPHAAMAARAAECAAVQGRFEELHDALFMAQDSIGATAWPEFARRAGVGDERRFLECMTADSVIPAIENDADAGRRIAVEGTPTLVISKWKVTGVPSMKQLDELVEKAGGVVRNVE
jgi:protein-disulfide isomerase